MVMENSVPNTVVIAPLALIESISRNVLYCQQIVHAHRTQATLYTAYSKCIITGKTMNETIFHSK